MNEHAIRVGALVHLSDGGGPTMTVTRISGDIAECAWVCNGVPESQELKLTELAVILEARK
jgi:uncharacterized protein YodC (DUF2158 family)